MKKSLKGSVAIFGVAGLVFLTGCGADTTVSDTVGDAVGGTVEVMEEAAQNVGEGVVDGASGAIDGAGDAMDATGDAMEKVGEGVVDGASDVMDGAGDAMEKTQEVIKDATEQTDGDVSLDMPYGSPAGPHTMPATLTIVDGVVTAASTVPEADATNGAVKKWQGSFATSFEAAVVGKSLADLQDIDAIGGASLTTDGFKKALAGLDA